jgi:hypothetical protein
MTWSSRTARRGHPLASKVEDVCGDELLFADAPTPERPLDLEQTLGDLSWPDDDVLNPPVDPLLTPQARVNLKQFIIGGGGEAT